MERLLVSIGKEQARTESLARKRARLGDAAASEAPSSSQVEELHPALASAVVQTRLFNSVLTIVEQGRERRLECGKIFVSRSTYAMFMMLQANKTPPYGPRWGCLLYICFYLVSNAYADGPYNLNHQEGLSLFDLKQMLNSMGMGPPSTDPLDIDLMKQARKWSRDEEALLEKAMAETWSSIVRDAKVKAAVRAALWPCQRAYLLFRTTA